MNGNFSRWQPENKPTVANIDAREFQYIAEEISIGFGLRAVDDRVRANDHWVDLPFRVWT
jgi:hypothetical protein